MTSQVVPPSVTETAFSCPHCGALTTQQWYDVYGSPIPDASRTPFIPNKDTQERMLATPEISTDRKQSLTEHFAKGVNRLLSVSRGA